jgi:hypothetical protein
MRRLDVGQPERAAGAALDDPAPEIIAQPERLIATRAGVDPLRAPVQELRVEGAGRP